MKMAHARALFVGSLLLLWELSTGGIASGLVLVDPFYVSSPSRVWRDLQAGFRELLLHHALVTLAEALVGLVLGIVSGLAVGLLFAFSPRLAEFGEPLMRGLNALPRPALAPLMLLWFGLGFAGKAVMAWSLVFFIVFYNTYAGATSIDPDVLNTAKVFRASRLQIMRLFILPGVLLWIFAALRVSVSFALIGAIIGEFVGARAGLGYELVRAQGMLETDRVFSAPILIGAVAAALIELTRRIENRLLKWRPAAAL
jgi:NitT/TauT family transport system permease protein